MKPGKAILAGLLLCALAPASAAASTAQVTGAGTLSFDAAPGEENGVTVRYRTAVEAGFDQLGDRFVIDDAVPIQGLPPACSNLDPRTVSCDGRLVGDLAISLGDGDDVLAVNTTVEDGVPRAYRVVARGGPQSDVMRGGNADDLLLGEDGRDVVAGWVGDDVVSGGTGIDGVIGFGGSDRLLGGPQPDALFALKGHDSLFGGGGQDVLLARDGQKDPRIRCGPGKPERAITDRFDPQPRSCAVQKKRRKK